ncbi:MAG: hypothetical protein OCD01_03765 [Fibrobacterales bacterium]
MKQFYFLILAIPLVFTQCISTTNQDASQSDSSSEEVTTSSIATESSLPESSFAQSSSEFLEQQSSSELPQDESSDESSDEESSSESSPQSSEESSNYEIHTSCGASSKFASKRVSCSTSSASYETIPIKIEVYTQTGKAFGSYTIQEEGEWFLGKTENILTKSSMTQLVSQPNPEWNNDTIGPPEENNDPMPLELTVIASSPNHYTTIYYMNEYKSITIDLDILNATPYNDDTNHYAGVTIAKANWSQRYCYGKQLYLEASFDNDTKDTIQSNSLGRYWFNSTNTLDSLKVLGENYPEFWMKDSYLDATITPESNEYMDIRFIENMVMADAPYIYLYPETTQDIEISMTFNRNAQIIKSIPTYNRGWKVRATPEGRLDDTYDFLFYDFAADKRPDRSEGWLVSFDEYKAKVPQILENLNLNEAEIEDFMDFWTPYFDKRNDTPFFAFYMEDLEEYNTLHVTPTPDALLRVFLYVELVDFYKEIPAPTIAPFERTGFTAVEWGIYSYNNVFNVDRSE